MPLTEKGSTIKKAMEEEYGPEKGEKVFYASANKGTIEGVHDDDEGARKGALKRAYHKVGGTRDEEPMPSEISNLMDARDQPAYKQACPAEISLSAINKKNREYWASEWGKKGE